MTLEQRNPQSTSLSVGDRFDNASLPLLFRCTVCISSHRISYSTTHMLHTFMHAITSFFQQESYISHMLALALSFHSNYILEPHLKFLIPFNFPPCYFFKKIIIVDLIF